MTLDQHTTEQLSRGSEDRASAFSLLVVCEGVTSTYPLPESGKVLIGRARYADIRVDHGSVSREHVTLRLGDSMWIEDLGSANGTRVGGVSLTPGAAVGLAPNDVIDLGEVLLVIQYRRLEQRLRRVCDPAFFELRVEEECELAARAQTGFSVARLEVEGALGTNAVQLLLASALGPRDLLSAREHGRYELLLSDGDERTPRERMERIAALLGDRELRARFELARCPGDGASAAALLGRRPSRTGARPARPLPAEFVVADEAMRRVCRLLERVADSELSVILLGETGVGKEICAEIVHRCSPRADRKFLRLNCAALAETLLESELFGHERGAFTGATSDRIGLLEAASGGTLFLDEVGDMPLAVQIKLLRVLEAKEVMRLGSRSPRPIDIRVIAATHQDLHELVTQGLFREDLFYRLNGISVLVPPLRERPDDIEPLARHFMARGARPDRKTPSLGAEALAWLRAQAWPGNVRELRNVIERASILCDGAHIEPRHLPLDPGPRGQVDLVPSPAAAAAAPKASSLRSEVKALERERIEQALRQAGGNQRRAAEKLGLSRGALLRRLERLGIARRPNGA